MGERKREKESKIGRGIHRYPGHDDCAASIYSAAEPVRGIWSEELTHARMHARGAVLSTEGCPTNGTAILVPRRGDRCCSCYLWGFAAVTQAIAQKMSLGASSNS